MSSQQLALWVVAGLFVSAGLVLVAVGRYVASGHPELIAGYQSDRYSDGLALAAWVGARIMLMGVVTGVAGLLFFLAPQEMRSWFYAHLAAMVALVIRVLFGMRRFRAPL
jgi:Ca2+/Na+ antiporter